MIEIACGCKDEGTEVIDIGGGFYYCPSCKRIFTLELMEVEMGEIGDKE